MIEFFAKESHFEDHLRPIYNRVIDAGYEACWVRRDDIPSKNTLFAVVAASGDLARANEAGKLIFYCEHGAGQSYGLRHTSYAGGKGRDGVCMFLDPGPHVTEINKRWHPHIPSVKVGVPKLDTWHETTKQEPEDPKGRPVVCFSFHWECKIAPETRSGFDHFKKAILEAKAAGGEGEAAEFEVVGHCHPRARSMVVPFYEKHGIRYIESFFDVLDEADIYVCDNSSTIFEFASIGKPVVLLNPPWYRKHVHYGLRFWNYADIGEQAHNSAEVLLALRAAALDTKEKKAYRLNRSKEIYYSIDGHAAERAADAILGYIDGLEQVKLSGFQLRAKKFSMGMFGFMDPGQTAVIFEDYALVNDTTGRFRRRVNFPEKQDPERRIRHILSKSKNYELVNDAIDPNEEQPDDLDMDFAANITYKDEFIPEDKSLSAEELYIIQEVSAGKAKTPIVHKSGKYKTVTMQRAWDRLEEEGLISKDPEQPHRWVAKKWGQ